MPRSLQIGISLPAFDSSEAVKDFVGQAEERGIDPLFELSYLSNSNFLEAVSFLKRRVLSVHAPCLRQEFFPNLGSRDQEMVEESLQAIRERPGPQRGSALPTWSCTLATPKTSRSIWMPRCVCVLWNLTCRKKTLDLDL